MCRRPEGIVALVLASTSASIPQFMAEARGLIEAFAQIEPDVPFVVRLDGTNDKEGRALLAEADLPNVHTEATMLGAATKVVELANKGRLDGGQGDQDAGLKAPRR